jgi:hypothetical protein
MSQAETLSRRLVPAALAILLAAPPASAEGPQVVFRPTGDGATVDVRGLDTEDLARLKTIDWDARRWSELLAVRVADAGAGQPPVLGSYRVAGDILKFEPRFPFVPGVRYRAAFRPDRLPGRQVTGAAAVEADFAVGKSAPGTPTAVREVYPTRSTLPENQLKFYLHFTAPMRQGNVYEFIHLLDSEGKEVDGAFLEVDEELWDREGRRLTLFVDPGRIKHEVGPREGFGPVLEAGKTYTLLIEARWPDAQGRPLAMPFRKTFRTTAADRTCPDLKAWSVRPPAGGGTAPLVVTSPEPLDHALFGRLVRVRGPDGRVVDGRVAVSDEETVWSFTPDRPWVAGTYQLVVDTTLEDLAGNNLQRPFELDVFDRVARRIEARDLTRPFGVRPADR